MSTTVDSLDIQISANAQRASNSLNGLITKLTKINSSLNRVGDYGMSRMATGVSRLATAMTQMNNIQTTDFTRLAKNLSKMGDVNSGQIRTVASGITNLTKSLKSLSKSSVSSGAEKIAELISAISKFGYKSATQAIKNIPDLGKAMMDLMKTLSKAPRVSRNLIDMTNALAKLARTGASSGRAVNSLSGAFDVFSRSSTKARKKSFSLASAIGKLYASYFLLFRAIGGIRESVDIASGLTEVQNVVDVTFGKYSALLDKMAETSIQDLGMSELTLKQVASGFQAMGTAMGFTQEQMAKMSIDLTKLTADMSSFYNVNQKDMSTSLKAIFTGETEPLRKYGLDLTEATLQQFAFSQGLGKSVNKMTQMEKSMLRYQYVMANTTAAQGDFLRTQDTWANQTRILAENLKALGAIGGGVVINTLKPLVKALNQAMVSAIQFAETISEALGTIFGWKIEFGGGITQDMEEVDFSTGDISDNLGSATDNANKLKKVFSLMPFDQLNQLASNMDDASGNGGSGLGNTCVSAGSGAQANIVPMEGLLKKYTSEINSLYKLGEHIGKVLTETLRDINWGSVYLGAARFGKGLADFLNGLISPELFVELGKTIASALNTVLYAAYNYLKNFEWDELGESIASLVNNFFRTYKFDIAAQNFNLFAHGILDAMIRAIKDIEWDMIGARIGEYLADIDFIGIGKKIGELIWEGLNAGFDLMKSMFDAAPLETVLLGLAGALKLIKWEPIKSLLNVIGGGGILSYASMAAGLGLVVAALDKFGVIDVDWEYLYEKFEQIKGTLSEFVSNIDWQKLIDSLGNLWDAFVPFASGFADALIEAFDFLVVDIGAPLINGVAIAIDTLTTKLSSMDPEDLKSLGASIFYIASSIKAIKITKSLLDNIKMFGSSLKLVKKLLAGGTTKEVVTEATKKSIEEVGEAAAKSGTKFNLFKSALAGLIGKTTAVYGSAILGGIGIAKMADAARGGNGDISEFGGLIDTVLGELGWMEAVTSTTSDNIFRVKEELESSGASVDVYTQRLTTAFKQAGVSTDQLRQAFSNAQFTMSLTEGQIALMDSILGSFEGKADITASTVKENLTTAFGNLKDKIKDTIDPTGKLQSAVESLDGKTSLLSAVGLALMNWALKGTKDSGEDAKQGIDTLSTSVNDFINATPNMNKKFRSLAEDVGIQFPEGMKKSLTDGLPEIERATKSLTDMIISTSENNLEIHSPSRVGWRITEYYLRGLANGIYENTSLLTNALNSLFSHFSNISNSMFGYGRDAGRAFADGFSSVHVPTPHMRISDWRLHNLPNGGRMQSPVFEVNWYKQGGLINGELWGMNESGNPEMVGKVGNGRTGVANNAIIAESIEVAVVRGMTQVLMNASFGNNDNRPIEMVVAIDGREVARAVNRANERTGYRMNP